LGLFLRLLPAMLSGMFELNFNDERYLPFEGAGAISDWEISMPIENNYFDFASLSDVILHINYTSRNGGGQFTTEGHKYTQGILPNSAMRLFSLKHEFPSEWYRFFNPEGAGDQEFVVNLKPEHYPFFVRQKLNTLKIKKLDLFVETNLAGNFSFSTILKMTNTAASNELTVNRDPNYNDVHAFSREFTPGSLPNTMGEIRLKTKLSTAPDYKSLADDTIDNIFILLQLGT
jgi:Tc toxin complex TcA C-terminal TcB-binding domain